MAYSGKSITFGADLLPNSTALEYSLGDATHKWKINGVIAGGTNGQILKSDGTNSTWADEYKVEILDLTGVT